MALAMTEPVGCVTAFASHCDEQDGEETGHQMNTEITVLNSKHGDQLLSDRADESSDDDVIINFKTKTNKRKTMKNISSDDSDDESTKEVSQGSFDRKDDIMESAELENENEPTVSSSSESRNMEDVDVAKQKVFKRRRKVIANDSDSDDSQPLTDVINMPKNRRSMKRKLQGSNREGTAMQQLRKQREKLKERKLIRVPLNKQKENTIYDFTNHVGNSHDTNPGNDLTSTTEEDYESKLNKIPVKHPGDTSSIDMSNDKGSKDSNSEHSDEVDSVVEMPTERKKYGTRSKFATADLEGTDNEYEKDKETMKLLDNRDLFDAESSDSGNECSENEENDNKEEFHDETRANIGKLRKMKRITKNEKLKTQSEQQKLQRDVSQIHIPYHEPAQVSINDFLGRVPKICQLQRKKRQYTTNNQPAAISKEMNSEALPGVSENTSDNDSTIGKTKSKKICLPDVPKLTKFDNKMDNFATAKPGLNSFMQRLEKHTAPTLKPKQTAKVGSITKEKEEQRLHPEGRKRVIDLEKLEKAPPIPGSRLMLLKSQLQSKMRVQREENRKEAIVRHKLENEEFSESEEDVDDQEHEDDEAQDGATDEDVEDNSIKASKRQDVNSNDEDDDELDKWNTEEQKKQIELQLDELDEVERSLENAVKEGGNQRSMHCSLDENTATSARTVGSSLDLFPGVNDTDHSGDIKGISSEMSLHLTENTQWDESNTIPPGQGNAFVASTRNRLEASTPFSKLLRNGLFGSQRRSSSDDPSNDESQNDNDRSVSKIITESTRVGPIISDDLHFTLDENTQYSQILDTQGYFQSGTKQKKPTKLAKLFDVDDDDGNTVSQLLGLCSGNFDERKSGIKTLLHADDFGLPSDLPCENETEIGNTQDILRLCSGQFTSPPCSGTKSDQQSNDLEFFSKEKADTSDSLVKRMSSETSTKIDRENDINLSAFEETKSTSSLIRYFGKTDAACLEGRKSFENLFKNAKESNERENISENEQLLAVSNHSSTSNHDDDDDDRTKNDSQRVAERRKVFYIGDDDVSHDNSDNDDGTVAKDDENSLPERIVSDASRDHNISDNDHDEGDGDEDEDCEDVNEDQDDGDEVEDCEDVNEDQDDEEVNEELEEYHASLKNEKKFSKKNFYEEEAELSGSDVGDDDEELGSEADEYEDESDMEDLPSAKKLKAQVHRAHMKAVLEDDKQEIRYIQERFYEDGDLLSDGNGRRRNFRWRNIDKLQGANTANSDGSDNEAHDNDAELESQREVNKRIQRFEREAFLEDQRQKSQDDAFLDESSQSILNIIKEKNNSTASDEVTKIGLYSSQPVKLRKSGSFLERSKTTLSRLSSITSNDKKANAPTRSFVFQAKSSNSTPDSNDHSKKIRRTLSDSEPPAAKKAKFERTLSSHIEQSIFKHF